MELYIGTIQHWKLRAGDKESSGNMRGPGHPRASEEEQWSLCFQWAPGSGDTRNKRNWMLKGKEEDSTGEAVGR